MRPHISFSELASFVNGCQWKWKLSYLDGHRTEDFSVDLDFGTSIHAACEAYMRRKNPISIKHAQILFQKKFDWLLKKHRAKYPKVLSAKDYTGLCEGAKVALAFLKSTPELKDFEPVHNEFKLFEQIDGVDMKFKGFIDIVLKGKDKRGKDILWIADFKTCSWGWDREKREDRWRHFQLFLYKFFLCKKFNIDPKNVRTAFILIKKRPSKGADPVEWFPISAGPVSVQRALDELGSGIAEMTDREKDNSYKKDRTQCEAYGRKCPFWDSPFCSKSD